MKMKIKRHIALTVLLIYCFCTINNVNAKTIINPDFSSFPDGWTSSVTSGNVSAENGVLTLEYDSTSASARAKAYVDTAFCNYEDNTLAVDILFKFNGANDDTRRSLMLSDDDEWELHNIELLNISNSEAVFFGNSEASSSLEENKQYDIKFFMDMSDSKEVKTAVCMNGEKVYTGSMSPTKINFSAMKFSLRNYISKKTTYKADWQINAFSVGNIDEAGYEVNVSDGDTLTQGIFNSFDIDFNGEISDEAFEAANYSLYKNDEKIDFTAETGEKSVKITPDEGFINGMEYTLTINSIKDIFSNVLAENESYTIMIIPEGYKKPSITITPNTNQNIRDGKNIEFSAQGISDSLDRIEFVVNGTTEKTSETNNISYTFEKPIGEYEVCAVIYDTLGCKATSDTVKITVSENDAPHISFQDYTGSAKLTPTEAKNVAILASDSDGISKVELYANGEKIGTASKKDDYYIADLSILGIGNTVVTATAYDIYGKKASVILSIEIYVDASITIFEDNEFTNTATPSLITFASGMKGWSRRGFIDSSVIDDEHGNSLCIGMDTPNENYIATDFPYVSIPIGYTGIFENSFEIYFSDKPTPESAFIYSMFQTDGTRVDTALVKFDSMISLNGTKYEYEANKWYRIVANVDPQEMTYTIKIYDEDKLKASTVMEFRSNVTAANEIRFSGSGNDAARYYAAIDNIRISRLASAPTFNKIGADGVECESDAVPYTSQYIEAYLSGNIYGFNKECVSLKDSSGRNTAIEKAGYDDANGRIVIYPKKQLSPNTKYTIVLDKQIQILEDIQAGADIKTSFTTTAGEIKVESINFSNSGNKLSITTDVSNNSTESKKIYVIATIWNDKMFKGLSIEETTVDASDSATVNMNISQITSNERVDICVWDSFTDATVLAKKTYEQ